MAVSIESLSLSPASVDVLRELGFEQLTEIQEASIPVLLEGRDLIGQSKTGSGKTAAFALPILERLVLERRQLQALVLCPTRELSAQVARELRKLGRRRPSLSVLVLAGGEPIRGQIHALERGVHIAVGTPGRILDHLRRFTLELREVATIVLDEADRMLDMGFEEDMGQILDALPDDRQTVFFSATFPSTIMAMSRKYQREPARIIIEGGDERDLAIRQLLMVVETDRKPDALDWVLSQHPHESALIFANQKSSVAQLTKRLQSQGLSVACLHGDLEQFERDRVMAKFRNASTRVLIATDVAARGIDVANLDLVVNYDLPAQPEVYVHRIGRTGRAGKTGIAVSLANPRERAKVQAIEARTGVTLERTKRSAPALVVDETSGEAAGEQAAPSPKAPEPERAARMDTLQISGGRKQKVRPGDILGALTGEAGGLQGTDIGKIEIHDNFSYVAVAASVSRAAHKSLSHGRIKGKKFVITFVK
jgi:ATP-dependent RNA helicase DbpA